MSGVKAPSSVWRLRALYLAQPPSKGGCSVIINKGLVTEGRGVTEKGMAVEFSGWGGKNL